MKVNTEKNIYSQNGPRDLRFVFELEFVSKIDSETEVSKKTSVRNADKKENFFNWKIKKIAADQILGCETPDPNLGKITIPYDKRDCGKQNCGP